MRRTNIVADPSEYGKLYEVKIFDADGNIKEVIPPDELYDRRDKETREKIRQEDLEAKRDLQGPPAEK